MHRMPYKTVYRERQKMRKAEKVATVPREKLIIPTNALLEPENIPKKYPIRFHVEARNGKFLEAQNEK